jgi:RNA polymerase sigma-70 factor, ECF subfamily
MEPLKCVERMDNSPPKRKTDPDAEFLDLLARHERPLAACVHALVPNWQDAEEVLQETRVTLWRQFADFRPGSDFLAWARTVARYIARTHLRRSGYARQLFSEDVAEILIQEMQRSPGKDDRRHAALAHCTERLKDDAQKLLRRFYGDGEKIKQIAAEMGRSLHGTYMALSRIRRALLECIELRLRQKEQA